MKKFAVFDIDGTVFRSSLVLEAMYELIRKGVFPGKARDIFAEKLEHWRARKDANAYDAYIEAIVQSFNLHIKGLSTKALHLIAENVVREQSEYTYVYTRDLIRSLRASGQYTLIAISGSPMELVQPFTDRHGFDIVHATKLVQDEGVYTGEFVAAYTGKDKLLQQLIDEHDLSLKGSIAVGDSRGDVGMLSLVERPIAFNPDKDLFAAAKREGWEVVVERKNVIYELEPNRGHYKLA